MNSPSSRPPIPNQSAGEHDPDLSRFVLQYEDLEFGELQGTGGSGEVYDGFYTPKGEHVAIKKLHMVKTDTQSEILYKREVDCLAKLHHPFLLPFIGYTTKPPYCIVTKFMANDSLYAALHNDTKNLNLNPTEITFIAYGIAAGMAYLHSQKMIHRDLKTQNVLLDERKYPIICDFGSSREKDILMTGTIGTPNYMAPEFLKTEPYDEKVDVYAFGMILWELLTHEVPFFGLDSTQIIYHVVVLHSQPDIPEDAPHRLQETIKACLSINPTERPSFEELKKAFERGHLYFQDYNKNIFQDLVASVIHRPPPKPKDLYKKNKMTNNSANNFFPLPQQTSTTPPPFPKVYVQRRSSLQFDKTKFDSASRAMTVRPSMLPSSIGQYGKTYLEMLNTHPQQIPMILDFFENHAESVELALLKLWEPFLIFIKSVTDPEILTRTQMLLNRFAQNRDLLYTIEDVQDLHKYICPSTLELFLYVVKFVQDKIDLYCIDALINLCPDEECGEQAIILLCKIVLSSPHSIQNMRIILFFQSNVCNYAEMNGGHLMLLTVVQCDVCSNDMIKSFAASSIVPNIIAAYQALFIMERDKPSLFELDAVLKHVTSDDEPLRVEALEFLRRYAKNAEREPLIKMVDALLTAATHYSSEQAVLLLCRIANSDFNRYRAILQPLAVPRFMKCIDAQTPMFLKMFLTLFKHERARVFFMTQSDTPNFLNNSMRFGGIEEFLAVCWVIWLAADLNAEFSAKICKNGLVQKICEKVPKFKEQSILILVLSPIVKVAKYNYVPEFSIVIQYLIYLILHRHKSSLHCIRALTAISQQPEAHPTLLKENIISVLKGYTDNGEADSHKHKLLNNLKKGGLYQC